MPSFCCRHPTCTVYLKEKGYCPEHAEQGRREDGRRHQYYDQHLRDPGAKEFYNSAAWQRARATSLSRNPWCSRCRTVWARHVHHIKPLAECSERERVDQSNLMPLCAACHNAVEAEQRKGIT